MMNIFNNLEEIIIMGQVPLNSYINADCFDVFPYIKDKSIDMILADLPFGTTKCSWDIPLPLNDYVEIKIKNKNVKMNEKDFFYYSFLNNKTLTDTQQYFKENKKLGLWTHYKRIIKDNGAILLFGQPPFDKILGTSNLKMLRYEWIWEKTQATGHLNAKEMPMKSHESVQVFYKHLPTYNPIMTEGHIRKVSSAKNRAACIVRRNDTDNIYNNEYPEKVKDYDSTTRYPRDVIKFKTDKQKSTLHKTQKPVELLKYFIKTYTNENDLVLDNVGGSFSTGIACDETNRNFIGIEMDQKIFDSGINRVKMILNK
jgi:DNA modification methylase